MDNNVSKNTFSHKFFKLRFTKEKTSISIKKLLKQELLQTLDLYQQQTKVQLDLKFISTILERKIVLFQPTYRKLLSENQEDRVFAKSQSTSIVYSCSIAFVLAPYFLLSAQVIAENLLRLSVFEQNNFVSESYLELKVEIINSGWINFYLDRDLASWLEESLVLFKKRQINRDYPLITPENYQLEQNTADLFSIQYVHARCCSLLRLGAREKLIALKDENFSHVGWQLEKPQTISWLDEKQNLWFIQEAEYSLLRQLLMVSDAFASKSNDWLKLAFNLAKTVEVFLAECRFLGLVKRETPQKAIARLGLIAMAQYWLQRILLEKLKVAAPTSL